MCDQIKDAATTSEPTVVKPVMCHGYENENVDRCLQRFTLYLANRRIKEESPQAAIQLALHLSGPAESFYYKFCRVSYIVLHRLTRSFEGTIRSCTSFSSPSASTLRKTTRSQRIDWKVPSRPEREIQLPRPSRRRQTQLLGSRIEARHSSRSFEEGTEDVCRGKRCGEIDLLHTTSLVPKTRRGHHAYCSTDKPPQ